MAANAQDIIKSLVKDTKIKDLNGTIFNENFTKNNSWQTLLNFLHNTDEVLPIFQSAMGDEPKSTTSATEVSVFNYINYFCDLDKREQQKIIDTLINKIKEDGINLSASHGAAKNSFFWNESVNKAIAQWTKYFDWDYIKDNETLKWGLDTVEVNGSIPMKDVSFRIIDMLEADAGASFDFDVKEPLGWVVPWYNYDMNTYNKVRSTDKVKSVLSNSKNLHFTQGQEKNGSHPGNYNRLMMPKNIRRVEVEDLNRNFWVISQVTTGVSGFLFSDNNPIALMFNNLLNEIVQLWENILYLWVTLALIALSQNYDPNIHFEVLYLPATKFQPYKKYDNILKEHPYTEKLFDESNFKELLPTIEYIKDKYSKQDICIIPVVRSGNYWANYYTRETYPAICIYDRIKQEWFFKQLIFLGGGFKTFYIDIEASEQYGGEFIQIKNGIYGIQENEEEDSVIRCNNLNDMEDLDGNVNKYTGMIEVVPSIESIRRVEDHFEIKNLKFSVFDKIKDITDNNREPRVSFVHESANLKEVGAIVLTPGDENTTSGKKAMTKTLKKGYYKGELLSTNEWSSYTSGGELQYDNDTLPISNDGYLIKIGDFFPNSENFQNIVNNGLAVNITKELNDSNYYNKTTTDRICIREALTSEGRRTGYQCNLTVGTKIGLQAQDTDKTPLFSNWFLGHDNGNSITKGQGIFLSEELTSAGFLSFNKIYSGGPSKKELEDIGKSIVANFIICKKLFEGNQEIKFFITAIGLTSWVGGASESNQGYQGYWEHALLCHYFRYTPKEFYEGTEVSTSNFYPVKNGETTYGYIDQVNWINRNETVFKYNGMEIFQIRYNDRWRLPKLTASSDITNIIKVDPSLSPKTKHYYNKETGKITSQQIDSGSNQPVWYISKDDLNIKNNDIGTAIKEYDESGKEKYNKIEAINHYYSSRGTWNVFDGYNENPSGNIISYTSNSAYRQILSVGFIFDENNNIIKDKKTKSKNKIRNSNSGSGWAEIKDNEYEDLKAFLSTEIVYTGNNGTDLNW